MVDMLISRKREFTISCDASGGIVITDGDGKKGGNVASKQGRKIAWTNATEKPCWLEFTQLLPGDGADSGDRIWPFHVTPQQPEPADRLLAIQAGDRQERTLMNVDANCYVEYQVLDAAGAPLRDPVIIIEH